MGEKEDERNKDLNLALQTVGEMRRIRAKKNLGRGSSLLGWFGGEAAKDRGEYETLGNSLIQYASNIPIRNRVEFEKLAGRLSDPDITDKEAEGILDGLEKIISGKLTREAEEPSSKKKITTPEESFSEKINPKEKEIEKENEDVSNLAKAGKLGAQYGLGVLSGTPLGMAYEIAVAPLAFPGGQEAWAKQFTGDILSDVYPTEEEGKEVTPGELKEPVNLSLLGLAEKATGADLQPKGWLEKAVHWAGFVKNPQNLKKLAKDGITPKDLAKAIMPSGKEAFRGAAAGAALQLAEENQLGPLATIAATLTADIAGHGPSAALNIAKEPKKAAAQAVNFLTQKNSKKLAAQQLVEDFNKAGMKMDAGTLTDSKLVQFMQAKLSQSGLTGDALDNLRKDLSSQVSREYENVLGEIGAFSFENQYQASEKIKDALNVEEINLNIPKESLKERAKQSRPLEGRIAVEPEEHFQQELLNRIAPEEFENSAQAGQNLKETANDIKQPIKEQFNERWSALDRQVEELPPIMQPELEQELREFVESRQGSILLGESTPEYAVFQDAQRLLRSLEERNQFGIGATVNELIKTKRTLADIADWEFGGSNFKSAYKKLVGDLDSAINRSIGATNPELLQEFHALNADYAAFKDVFENKNVKSLFEPKNENYVSIHNEFSSNPDKIRALEEVLGRDPRGQQVLNQAKRDYAQRVTDNPNITPRDLRNLEEILGPDFTQDLENFAIAHQHHLDHPLPRAARQEGIPLRPQRVAPGPSPGLIGRIGETTTPRAAEGVRKKMYEYLNKLSQNGKHPEKMMRQMDTVKGIKDLRHALETTEEGRKLFKELSRYKIAEMIDKKMKDSLTGQIKLGTFSRLLDKPDEIAILKELIGRQSVEKIQLLQKNSGKLHEAAAKFLNTSQSGATALDVGILIAGITAVFSGNPFLIMKTAGSIGSSVLLAKLFSDPVFLKELEKAILTENPKVFRSSLEKMKLPVQQVIQEGED